MKYRCHQCYGVVDILDVAHVDLYVDLCWIQCDCCAEAFGPACGVDRRVNPHPHGYFTCPLRLSETEQRRYDLHIVPKRAVHAHQSRNHTAENAPSREN